MRRIVFILSLILMIGIQTEAQYIYEGACIDVILYFKDEQTGYYDLPIQVESSGHIYNCYIRIQFIKK